MLKKDGTYRTWNRWPFLTFSPENTVKLYEKVEDDDCQFVLKDMRTREAKEVK
jgi:hypothetical protein